ncbi:MAG: hypothetical protein JWO46_3472 [Nocardioidaceae bacterium]|nr:hypothetical protein [Nocardioidaceae bacterium]
MPGRLASQYCPAMRRVVTVVAGAVAGLAAVGILASFLLNTFLFDQYDHYGQVPIPGTGTIHLPAGRATISFHALTPSSGGAQVVPALTFRMQSPDGATDPVITEDGGGFTSVNSDVHARVWVMQVAQAGDYVVETDGDVSAYISPRLAFGRSSPYAWTPWAFVGVFVAAMLVLGATLLARASGNGVPGSRLISSAPGPMTGPTFNPTSFGATPAPTPLPPSPSTSVAVVLPEPPVGSSDVLERLEALAKLKASGDLTPAEFETAKNRVLGP